MPTPAIHVWRPSSARTVQLDAFVPVPRGTVAAAPPPLSWAAKDPAEILDYQFDISPALLGNPGDAIADLDVVIAPANPGDLVLNSALADGTVAVLWFAQGFAGTTYTVTLTIITTNGRTINRSVLLPVLALSSAPVAAAALQTAGGTPLTDQNGNPIVMGT